ncbi:ABC transporter substrate-binding protein, partial [Pseudomonas fragi]|nr:ABC transporter substrate-binding protein [Pseudomonas sp. GC01]
MNNLKQWLGGTLLALGIATQPVLAAPAAAPVHFGDIT